MCQRNVVVRQFPPQRERFLSPKFPPHRLARAVTRSSSGDTSPPLRNPIRLRFIGEQRHRHHFSFFWRQCFPFRPARLPLLSSPLHPQKRLPEVEVASGAAVRFVPVVSRAGFQHGCEGKGRQGQEGASTLQGQSGGEIRCVGCCAFALVGLVLLAPHHTFLL